MELRYRIENTFFVPQYKLGKEEVWRDFLRTNIGGDLLKICGSLGNIQYPRRMDAGQWYIESKKSEEQYLIFTKEIFVLAFLGAAKAYFDTSESLFLLLW